jgi:hypothetical protein
VNSPGAADGGGASVRYASGEGDGGGATGGKERFESRAGGIGEALGGIGSGDMSLNRPKIAVNPAEEAGAGGGTGGGAAGRAGTAGGGAIGCGERGGFTGFMIRVGELKSSSLGPDGIGSRDREKSGPSTFPKSPVNSLGALSGAGLAGAGSTGALTESSQLAKSTKEPRKSVTATDEPSTSTISNSLSRVGGRKAPRRASVAARCCGVPESR